MRWALVLTGVHQAGLGFQLLLEPVHLCAQLADDLLLLVQHAAELLQQFLLVHVADFQLGDSLLVHGRLPISR